MGREVMLVSWVREVMLVIQVSWVYMQVSWVSEVKQSGKLGKGGNPQISWVREVMLLMQVIWVREVMLNAGNG